MDVMYVIYPGCNFFVSQVKLLKKDWETGSDPGRYTVFSTSMHTVKTVDTKQPAHLLLLKSLFSPKILMMRWHFMYRTLNGGNGEMSKGHFCYSTNKEEIGRVVLHPD